MGSDKKVNGTPDAIAVDAHGQIYVTNYSGSSVLVFSLP